MGTQIFKLVLCFLITTTVVSYSFAQEFNAGTSSQSTITQEFNVGTNTQSTAAQAFNTATNTDSSLPPPIVLAQASSAASPSIPASSSMPMMPPTAGQPPVSPPSSLPQSSPGQSISPPSASSSQSLSQSLPGQAMSPPPAHHSQQFQEWLEKNGYAKGSSKGGSKPSLIPPPPLAKLRLPSNKAYYSQIPSNKPMHPTSAPTVLSFEQGQKAMLEAAPPDRGIPSPDSVVAFNQMMQQNMPLQPSQVVQLHQQIDVAQRAAATPANIPPKPVSSTLMVNLAPGTTPPAIRLAQGYVSSLVFVDSTGSPWPIAAFDIGNPKAVNIQWDGKSNILIIQAVSPYSNGDIVVRLVGLPTPVTLELVSGQRVVDYRVDIHVSGIGPNTKELPMGTPLPNSANQLLLGVLDGVAPAGSKLLNVSGADCQAWLLGEKIYFRTRLTVLSPGWIGKMVSPDGTQAYELPKTSVILVSRYGEPAEIKVEGF